MKIVITFFCLSLFIACSSPEQVIEHPVDVIWGIGRMNNEGLDSLKAKLLQAIGEGQIEVYDSSMELLSIDSVKRKIRPDMFEFPLSIAECNIMLANGDSSCIEYLQSYFTPVQIERMLSHGQNPEELYRIKRCSPFEWDVLRFELVEHLSINSSHTSQKGTMKFVRLIIPSLGSGSGQKEMLCQIKYEDFSALDLPGQNIIDDRTFNINTYDSDITLINGDEVECLSLLKVGEDKSIDEDKVDDSVFKYFKNNIICY